MKIFKTTMIVLMVGVLVACNSSEPSESAIQTSIAQTQIALPTGTSTLEPTRTPIVLSEINLEPYLNQSGDLPAGFSAAQVSNSPPEMFSDISNYDNVKYQRFEHDNETSGGVTVFLFTALDDLDNAYNQILSEMGDVTNYDDIGEGGAGSYLKQTILNIDVEFSDLLFTRCNALVHIRFSDANMNETVLYLSFRKNKRT